MKIGKTLYMLLVILIFIPPTRVLAQDPEPKMQMVLIRNFGYGGFGRIQGRFTLKIKDLPNDIEKVEYYLDEELLSAITKSPFEYKFHTSEFSEGEHVLFAIVYRQEGVSTDTNKITKVFLSSEQAWSDTQRLIVPLLLFTAGLTLLGLGIPVLVSRKKDFVIGKYGPAGGAVCPRCRYPFSRSVFAPNLLVGKLVNCPHCGKVSIQPRAAAQQLQEAEKRYKNLDPDLKIQQKEREYRRLLDDSRYED